ncbi:MAG TPA: amino acid ABC transporter substrate-binding protein [Xanthobacteraceae bacterium]|nr:amino acid ABC transporter substrate-binding protein [Xanthobacteraceae bacterium]
MLSINRLRKLFCAAVATAMVGALSMLAAIGETRAAEPIKVGFSTALTGAVSPNGKQILLALQIWRDDVNANGGLLGRPLELVYYDDQSTPANVPGIYSKLLDVDKVDLLIGPYATNMIAAAMPTIMEKKMTTIGLLGIVVNRQFHYPRYFSMLPTGPEGILGFSKGWFELAMAQKPQPTTVAIVAADAEFGRAASDGARANVKADGLQIVYDQFYPPNTMEFTSVMRAVQAAKPDLVFVASYPPDTVGIVRAAHDIDLDAKMFGGAMIGLLATNIKVQLGPLLNGIVNHEDFVPSPTFDFPGVKELLAEYQKRAVGQGVDPLGYGFAPFAYAAGQVIASAVARTQSLDNDKIATYIHANTFKTVVGDITFGADGEWAEPRMVFTQFRNVTDHDINQFRDTSHDAILWPSRYKTGELIYPYSEAKDK